MLERERQAPLELLHPSRTIGRVLGRSDADERIHDALHVAERLGDGDRTRSPVHGAVDVGGQHGELRSVAVRHRELTPRRKCFEHRKCLRREPLRVGAHATNPPQARQPAQRIAFAQTIAQRSPDRQRFGARRAGRVDRFREIALDRVLFEQQRPLPHRQDAGLREVCVRTAPPLPGARQPTRRARPRWGRAEPARRRLPRCPRDERVEPRRPHRRRAEARPPDNLHGEHGGVPRAAHLRWRVERGRGETRAFRRRPAPYRWPGTLR